MLLLAGDGHNTFRLHELRCQLFTALLKRLVANPVDQRHELQFLELWPPVYLRSEAVREDAQKHCLGHRRANVMAKLVEQMQPFVYVIVEPLEGLAGGKVLQFSSACNLEKLI